MQKNIFKVIKEQTNQINNSKNQIKYFNNNNNRTIEPKLKLKIK